MPAESGPANLPRHCCLTRLRLLIGHFGEWRAGTPLAVISINN